MFWKLVLPKITSVWDVLLILFHFGCQHTDHLNIRYFFHKILIAIEKLVDLLAEKNTLIKLEIVKVPGQLKINMLIFDFSYSKLARL